MNTIKTKRIIEFLLALLGIFVSAVLFFFLSIIVKMTSEGPVLYWSDRVGKNNEIFRMPKLCFLFVSSLLERN